ncbi:MAG: FAD synthetase family protein, partial [Clostridia bacterium]|nr:FAD synthetase family protein [Clostridia bacterium]
MKIYTREQDWDGGETVIAFGMFDGVHLGHRKLIETTCREAEKRGLTGMVFTFSNHPLSIITPDRIPLQLDTKEEKLADLEACGISSVLLRTFDREFANLSAGAFVERIARTLHPRVFVIGFNYTFGARGCGKAEDMRELGRRYGIDTCIVDRVQLEGETVSSSR